MYLYHCLQNVNKRKLRIEISMVVLYQLDCVDVASLTAAFYGALIPADFGTENEKLILSNKLLDLS